MQVQVSEEKAQVPKKKVHFPKKVQIPKTHKEYNLRGSLHIQRETL